MDRNEMLQRMGLTEQEFKQLLDSFREFYGSLNAAQQAVVNRGLPRFKQAAGLFGSDIKRGDMKMLLANPAPGAPAPGAPAPAPDGGGAGAFGQNGINQITNGDDGNG